MFNPKKILIKVYRLIVMTLNLFRSKLGLHNEVRNLQDVENIFTEIYIENGFGGDESVSGVGSSIFQTRVIIKELPILFVDLNIATILDIPCGDFHWMKNVNMAGINYIGADIVEDLIKKNTAKYGTENIRFRKLNLIDDKLPDVDLIFCRDCLVHLSFKDIFFTLNNICNSQSKYLLTTTFTERIKNLDIPTGQWRTLNLELSPFLLPPPIKIINEGCTEAEMGYTDKSLALWSIADIKKVLI